jgi:NAD(P)-dependent dehydrogenase (short-subunit alcohol dehydrogenase family)
MDSSGLNGKVALVTGAAAKRGMGHAIALRLASEGADVVVLDKFAAPKSLFPGDEGWRGLPEVVEEVEGLGRSGLALTADISSSAEIDEALQAALAKFGKIDLFVNCAAIRGTPDLPIVDGSEAEWRSMFEINLLGAFLISKAVARHMVERGGGGKIVHFASLAARMGVKGSAAYAASKWGVLGLVESLAVEVAPHGINVNAVCPGMIVTNLRDRAFEEQAESAGITMEEARAREYGAVTKMIPLGRMGTPQDIADVVSFLVSKQSDYMTGQALNVCGGVRMD